MVKFIDKNTNVKSVKPTVFNKYLDGNFNINEAAFSPSNFNNVEFIGHSEQYGDVFKVWDNDPQHFTLYFGIKGAEVYVNE